MVVTHLFVAAALAATPPPVAPPSAPAPRAAAPTAPTAPAAAVPAAAVETPDGPDVVFSKAVWLTVGGTARDGWTLVSKTTERIEYVSKRSTRSTGFGVGQPYYAEITELTGTLNGREVPDDAITHRIAQFRDVFLSDTRIFSVELRDKVKPGDVAEYTYEQKWLGPEYLGAIKASSVDRLGGLEVVVQHPIAVEVDFEVFLAHGQQSAATVDRSKPGLTRIRLTDLATADDLHWYPHGRYAAAVLPKLTAGGQPITLHTPEALNAWYRNLVGGPPTVAQVHIEALRQAVDAAPTPREKFAVIHDRVRKGVRYMADERSISAIVPRAPDGVWTRGYGDCKDKAFLITALGRAYGLDVRPVLAGTSHSEVPFAGTRLGRYNHMINAFIDGDTVTYVDATSQYLAVGDLPEGDVGAAGLILGFGEEAPRRVVIGNNLEAPEVDIAIAGSIDALDKARATVVLRGRYFGGSSRAIAELRGLDLENFLSNSVTRRLYQLSLDDFRLVSSDGRTTTFEAVADLSEFVIPSKTRRYVPQAPFRVVDADVIDRGDDAMHLQHGSRPWIRMSLELAGTSLKTRPVKVEVGDPAVATFSTSSTQLAGDGAGVRMQWEFRRPLKRFDGDSKKQYLDFARDYLARKRHLFILMGGK